MEQRLRLVGTEGVRGRGDNVSSSWRRVAVQGQIVWKDARGATRIVAVRTKEVNDERVSVECAGGMPIPLYRLVHFQIDKPARMNAALPECLRKSSVLCAVTRVGACAQATGSPGEYELRLLIEPQIAMRVEPVAVPDRSRTA